MVSIDPQSRKFILVINNYAEAGLTIQIVIVIIKEKVNPQYFCVSEEVGESGTPHIHIAIYKPSPIRFSALKRLFPTAHIEKGYGSVKEMRDYVAKEGKWEGTDKAKTSIPGTFFEFGDLPPEQEENLPKWAQVANALREGKTTTEIIGLCPGLGGQAMKIDQLREIIRRDETPLTNREMDTFYFYGATGTGKTRSIFAAHSAKDICRITNYPPGGNVRFDNYHGQDVLVFEEFRSQISVSQMLNYLDVYPLELPARYTDKTAAYHTVYITSNIPLEEQYLNEPETVRAAFARRIHNVHYFRPDGSVEVQKGA